MTGQWPNGPLEDVMDRARGRYRSIVSGWLDDTEKRVGDGDLAGLAFETKRSIQPLPLASVIFELALMSAMLGGLDVLYEAHTGRGVARQFAARTNVVPGVGIPNFTRMPFRDAIDAFAQRSSITKSAWQKLNADARTRAFTVARLAVDAHVEIVRRQVEKAQRDGWTRESFKAELRESMTTAGVSPLNDWHAETIIRTNTATAHSQGRVAQQTTPAMLSVFQYWEYDAVTDKTTRNTHKAANGVSARVDDPIWRTAYPPAGYSCRCSCIARRKGSDAPGSSTPLADLPDKGWKPTKFALPTTLPVKAPPKR